MFLTIKLPHNVLFTKKCFPHLLHTVVKSHFKKVLRNICQ